MELIAHRAGNSAATIETAASVADTVELDVHRFHRRLEVRHAKVVWPTRVQWDRWWIEPRPATPPGLRDVVQTAPAATMLWLDLKGFDGRLTEAVLGELDPATVSAVSSRSWWILRPARRRGVRTMRSVGSRWQLLALRLVRRWASTDGVVLHERFATPDVVGRLRERTSSVVTWAVEDIERATELLGSGVTGLIIDDLDLITELRERTTGHDR